MANENENSKPEGQPVDSKRRDFVKTSAQVAVTAPAVAMLLSSKPTLAATISPYAATASGILDDFTFGNNKEDIDGGPSLDDFT